MIERRTFTSVAGRVLNYTFLILFALTIVFPFYYIIMLSFNDGLDSLQGGIFLWPRVFTLDNYKKAFEYKTIITSIGITVSRTLIVTAFGLLCTSTLAYALTFTEMPGNKFISMFFYFTTLFSGGLIPTFILYRQIGILSTYWVLIIPSLYSVWNTFVMRTFFNGIPSSIAESARLDGAGEMTIFFRLILPLSTPVLATIALYIGVGVWNDWFTGEYFIMMRDELQPAATTLNRLLSRGDRSTAVTVPGAGAQVIERTTSESLQMAFVVLIIFPIMCVYPFLQKYFVKGALLGSVKG